jgi:hypothetical protein
MPSGHALPLYALASWLLTELLGALMVRSLIAADGVHAARQRPGLAAQLVEELLSRDFGQPSARTMKLSWRPLVPLGHGVPAIFTFLLAVLAAVATA